MLNKLSFRNMKRSLRDYLVYVLTMMVVTALMYAFNSLIFQNGLTSYYELEGLMEIMIGLATVFIVLIVAWLINYMVRFMLEKRSTEFGIYLLLGMKKKTIARLYMRENMLLGGVSHLAGLGLGVLLQQVLMAVMYSMVRMEFHLNISFHPGTIGMTVLCYGGCYLLALWRSKRRFRKMNIQGLMNLRRQNEEIKEKHEEIKRILLPLSLVFLLLFWAWFGRLSGTGETMVFLIGLVLTIYLFYVGISAWIICYVRRRGKGIYWGQNLFLLRQFASKIRTMQFTMGTLTSLFTLALMGASIALMFSEYENTVLDRKFPFDIQLFSDEIREDFAREKALVEESVPVQEWYQYHIYTDKGNQVNTWMLTSLDCWGAMYQKEDGEADEEKIKNMLENESIYYQYDTYMGLSDYNYLRAMLGYGQVNLSEDEYLVHVKERLAGQTQGIGERISIEGKTHESALRGKLPQEEEPKRLHCGGIYSEPFSQDGHNGADLIIVIPDAVLGRMEPYYTELVGKLLEDPLPDLQMRLEQLDRQEELLWADDDADYLGGMRCGSDNIIVYAELCLVRANLIPQVKYMLAALIIPLFYMGLVFVCVAVTVLSVQLLSDSAKYRFRYDVLGKLGLGREDIGRLIQKQLAAWYLCPAFLAVLISGKMILYVSKIFVLMTGVPAPEGAFFLKSILLFLGIYLVYFAVTDITFKRNIEQK